MCAMENIQHSCQNTKSIVKCREKTWDWEEVHTQVMDSLFQGYCKMFNPVLLVSWEFIWHYFYCVRNMIWSFLSPVSFKLSKGDIQDIEDVWLRPLETDIISWLTAPLNSLQADFSKKKQQKQKYTNLYFPRTPLIFPV